MEAFEPGVESIWFGRDLGYRGGRRTGLALTDEAHLDVAEALLGTCGLRIATTGPVVSERTASITWNVLGQLPHLPFLWNIFPFHPYIGTDHRTNRCHTRKERLACAQLLNMLVDWAPKAKLVAIGNDAACGLEDSRLEFTRVRHPSYGGRADFVSGMSNIYGIDLFETRSAKQEELF